MSICMCASINKESIDGELLGKIITDYFSPINNLIIKKENYCVSYENFYKDNKITIAFVNESNSSHNMWDSSICGGKFECAQEVIFYIDKEEATVDAYVQILSFCIFLKGKVEGDILVTSEVHNDICLLKESNIVWSQELSYDYSSHFS